jgi:1-acyl-sn-glycerol-3-phosphate acyltransferase
MSSNRISRLFRAAGAVTFWGRLEVEGLEHLPRDGAALLVANHDSQWDPVLIWRALWGLRPVRFLTRSNLWNVPVAGGYLTAMDHIPIARGVGDAQAIDTAAHALRAGQAIVIFPEGGLSHGRRVRARRGAARLARECPDAEVLLLAITGTIDYARFPRRPRVKLTVFPPAGGRPRADEDLAAASMRLMDEIRAVVPPVAAGRDGPIARRLRERRQAKRPASPKPAGTPPAVHERHAVHN